MIMPVNQLLDSLKEKQIELITRINAIENDFKKGRSQDFSEQATETENDQVLDEIRNESKSELQLVNEAIRKLANDQYGVCSHCSNDIHPERLHALPYTQTCIHCAH